MKFEISFSSNEIKGAIERKAKGECICGAVDCADIDLCEICPLMVLSDEDAIQFMESHQNDDEEEEPTTPTPDDAVPSIGALMVKKMIEAYERRN